MPWETTIDHFYAGGIRKTMTDYRLDHVGIGVRDLGAQISFYRDQLGFTEERRFDLPEAGLRIVVMNGPDGSRIELLAPSTSLPADGPARAGTKHVCFVVDDLDAVQNDLRSRGAAI
ncbi:MAG: VOC family protein, partial [Bacteroidota bacterium]